MKRKHQLYGGKYIVYGFIIVIWYKKNNYQMGGKLKEFVLGK
jgi:hypothetical protein